VFAAIKELRKNIDILNEDSFVFLILVRDQHPRRAALLADAVGERLEEMLRVQNKSPAQTKFEQIDALFRTKRAQFDALQDEIEELLGKHKVASVDEEISRGMERFSALALDEVRLRTQQVEARKRASAIDATLRRKVAQTGGGLSFEYIHPEDKRRLESEQLSISIKIDAEQARLQSIIDEIVALRDRLQLLTSVRLLLERLRVELEGVKRDMVQLRDARQEAEMRGHVRSSEVVLLHNSTVPTVPQSPIKLYHVGLALGTAMFVSVALIYVFQFFNIRMFFRSLGPQGRRNPPPPEAASAGPEGGGGDGR